MPIGAVKAVRVWPDIGRAGMVTVAASVRPACRRCEADRPGRIHLHRLVTALRPSSVPAWRDSGGRTGRHVGAVDSRAATGEGQRWDIERSKAFWRRSGKPLVAL